MAEEEKIELKPEDGKEKKDFPGKDESSKKDKKFKKGKKKGKKFPKGGKEFEDRPKPKGDNAGEWYWSSEMQGSLVTNIAYDHVTGKLFDLNIDTDDDHLWDGQGDIRLLSSDGSIMIAKVNMDIGEVNNVDDPINQAIINAYNKVRGTKTASVPFKSGDFGPYLYSIGSIFAFIGHLKRALSLVHYYNINNILMPIALFKAVFCGHNITDAQAKVVYDDVTNNYPLYVWQLNNQIERLVRISIPGNYSFFKKCEWIFNHTWYDDESGSHGNVYAYVPDTLYKFNAKKPLFDDATVVATGCDTIQIYEVLTTMAGQLAALKEMISALVEDDNAIQMSVWIDNNYEGASNAQTLANTDTNGPEFTQDVNKQFKNLIIHAGDPHGVQQNSSGYLQNDDYLAGSEADNDETILAQFDSYIYDTGVADVGKDFLVGSRMMQVLLKDESNNYRWYCDNFSCSGLIIFSNSRVVGNTATELVATLFTSNVLVYDLPKQLIRQMSVISQFKCKPTFFIVGDSVLTGTTGFGEPYSSLMLLKEFERPTLVPKSKLLNMMTYSIKAQFGLPNVNKVIKK